MVSAECHRGRHEQHADEGGVEQDGELVGDLAVGLDRTGSTATVGYTVRPDRWGQGLGAEAVGALVDALAKRLVFRTLPSTHRDAVLAFLGVTAATPLDEDDAAVGWRLPYLVALILDTPSHGIR